MQKNFRNYKICILVKRKQFKKLFKDYKLDNFRFGRGICLHILPNNTSINFAYSLVFGLMSGNSNILRIPNIDNLVKIIVRKLIYY